MCAPEAGENQHKEMMCWSGLGVLLIFGLNESQITLKR
jgi:hypothetical protein